MGNEQAKPVNDPSAHLRTKQLIPMPSQFRKGVQYNSSFATGWLEEFVNSVTPASEDIIKVELWDVVDYGVRANKNNGELKIEQEKANVNDIPINVYRNTHGVILMFDITKPWTFDYVKKELKSIPDGLTVLIVLSDIINVIAKFNLHRKKKENLSTNVIRYVESSLRTGQGLKYIYKFFGVPFLTLQKEVLRKQIEQKQEEMEKLLGELDNSEDAMFKNRINFSGDVESENDSETESTPDDQPPSQVQNGFESSHSKTPLEEYRPGELMDDFFKDVDVAIPPATVKSNQIESSDDEDNGNPLVANDEDIEISDDELEPQFTNPSPSPSPKVEEESTGNDINLFEIGEQVHHNTNNYLNTGMDFMSPYDSTPSSFSPYLHNEFSQDDMSQYTSTSERNPQFYDYNFNMNMDSLALTGSYEEIDDNNNTSSANPWVTNTDHNTQAGDTSAHWDEPREQDPLPSLQVTTHSDPETTEKPSKTKSKKKSKKAPKSA
ncbi:hypothetical protein K493DRAFT_297798 [Basidiobolus meristosporus CBS 931.73]|uniref:Uncharacterized protein n=1 Tax=Basidiobolus meristosporus CBS 931.73 TaxID=1314790 RepID=A0A1Y1YX82_9FUNG|nr:hypothetical protein K493DRAFT_297798 [Basidiobolus meristosporus CBS 931.73]|eukprot:ORY02589.1 hypothetical protein K493DRAFT_297798 [Basidiobolus meristosporus CBS 931.73]